MEIRKQEIKQITLKRVGTFRNGHLIIIPQSEKEIKIEIMPQDPRHVDPMYL
jgi:hypothetical protein